MSKTKIDIFSGFLGAGKTTLIKKLLNEAYSGEKVVLIENEFGEIGIDGGFLKEAGVEVTEMNSGCICCSLVGDFSEALKKVLAEYTPDRILIEPSGVGKLSDVIKAVSDIDSESISLNSFTAVVDAKKCKVYMKNFGEFYNDQIESAGCIVLSHVTGLNDDKINECINLIKEKNEKAAVISTPWEELDGMQILNAMEGTNTLAAAVAELEHDHDSCPVCGCRHNHSEHHDHDHEHEHHHHACCDELHHESSHEHGHEHHHHEHDSDCDCHKHEHHHSHDNEHACSCGCHEHEHEHEHNHDHDCGCHEHGHHHHADEVFTGWGKETTKKYTEEVIKSALSALEDEAKYGIVLRAKGIVAAEDGKWIHFDYVPGEADVRFGCAEVIGRLCVIGSKINTAELDRLFD